MVVAQNSVLFLLACLPADSKKKMEQSLAEEFVSCQTKFQDLQNSDKSTSDPEFQDELTELLKSLCNSQGKLGKESTFSANETVCLEFQKA